MVLFPCHSFRMRKTTRKGAIILALTSASCLAYWLHPMQPDYSVDAMFSYIKFDPDPSHAAPKIPGTGTYIRSCSARTWHGPSAKWLTPDAMLLGIHPDGSRRKYASALLAPRGDYAHAVDADISKSHNVTKVDSNFSNVSTYQDSAKYYIKGLESIPYQSSPSVADIYNSINRTFGEPTMATQKYCGNEIVLNYSKVPFPLCALSSGFNITIRYGNYSVSHSRSCM